MGTFCCKSLSITSLNSLRPVYEGKKEEEEINRFCYAVFIKQNRGGKRKINEEDLPLVQPKIVHVEASDAKGSKRAVNEVVQSSKSFMEHAVKDR